eukprot:766089-Hanusia_phi.AAC.2
MTSSNEIGTAQFDSCPARCPSSPTNQRALKKLNVADLYFFVELKKSIGEESSKQWLTAQMRPDVTKITHSPSRTTSSSSTATQELSSTRGGCDVKNIAFPQPDPYPADSKDIFIADIFNKLLDVGKCVQAILRRFVLRFSKICRVTFERNKDTCDFEERKKQYKKRRSISRDFLLYTDAAHLLFDS